MSAYEDTFGIHLVCACSCVALQCMRIVCSEGLVTCVSSWLKYKSVQVVTVMVAELVLLQGSRVNLQDGDDVRRAVRAVHQHHGPASWRWTRRRRTLWKSQDDLRQGI